jgi:ABC-type glycerol-3-phosphate transport system substrate-binding protein
MPLPLSAGAPTLLVRKDAFERAGLTRAQIDRALTLTDEEFRVEQDLVAIGPIFDEAGFASLVEAFEAAGISYFDDFFEMSGNWPDWMSVFAGSRVG